MLYLNFLILLATLIKITLNRALFCECTSQAPALLSSRLTESVKVTVFKSTPQY